jgi:glycosyltransferase involved in cell wall biosynthesis
VFFLGRLSEPKGVWDLLHAAEPVLAQAPNTRFVLGGVAEFPQVEREIRSFIAARGLTERVALPGTLRGEDKLAAFGAADLFCLPTHLDNQPVVLLEAMAAGLPIVSTRVGVIPEMMVDGEHGLLIPPGDRGQLVDALVRLLGDDLARARMGALGRAWAAAEFDRRVVIAKLMGEIEAVHRARHPVGEDVRC